MELPVLGFSGLPLWHPSLRLFPSRGIALPIFPDSSASLLHEKEILSKVVPLRGGRVIAVPTKAGHLVGSKASVAAQGSPKQEVLCNKNFTNILDPQVCVQRGLAEGRIEAGLEEPRKAWQAAFRCRGASCLPATLQDPFKKAGGGGLQLGVHRLRQLGDNWG